MSKVFYGRHGSLTGKLLQRALDEQGYSGPDINWGCSDAPASALNPGYAVRRAAHKKNALETLKMAHISTLLVDGLVTPADLPVVGRKNYHTNGSGFWLCNSLERVALARKEGATHFQRYLPEAREFRVHIMNNKSYRISEKYGLQTIELGTHQGGKFKYPRDFKHLKELREIAKHAVKVLELDFAAVDILYDKAFYVLECNTAPSLTTHWSHLLPIYVAAFKQYEKEASLSPLNRAAV